MKKVLAVLAVLVLAVGGGVGFFLWKASLREIEMSEKPLIVATDFVPGESTSRLNLTVTINDSLIQKAIEENLPAQFSDSGTHREKTFPFRTFIGPGPVVYVDTKWSILADRGKVSVSKHGDGLRIDIPISVSGWGGIKGDGAKLLGLGKKNIRGAIEAFIDVTFDIDGDWSPQVKVTPSFKWTSPAKLEVIGGVWIDVSGKVGGQIQNALNAAAAKIPAAINRDLVRQAISHEWKARSFAIGNLNGSEAKLEVIPTGAGFSGITYTVDGVQFAVALIAKDKLTFGTFQESVVSSIPLPKLERIASGEGNINITVPLELKYTAIESAVLAAIPPSGFSGDSPLGKANVQIEKFSLYTTSNGKLAFGLLVTVKCEKRILTTHGWLWLTGAPTLDVNKQEVAIRDVNFTRQLDNQLVSVATSLLRDPIKTVLEQNTQFDLKPKLAEARRQLTEYLNDPSKTSGVLISVRPDKIGLTEIVSGSDSLFVKTRFDASASIELK
jgi:Domain of unknown function (DUF4403)